MQPTFEDRPHIVIWEMTRACALACRHCRACAVPARDRAELSTSEAYTLIEEIAGAGTPLLVLSGGDPLERDDICDIISHARRAGLRVAVTPSATARLTPEAIQAMKAAGAQRMALSIDAPTAAAHDAFRRVAGSFSTTLNAARFAREIGLETQIHTTATRDTVKDIEATALLVEELGSVLWSVFSLIPVGRARASECLDAAEHEALFERLLEVAERSTLDVKTTEALHYRRFIAQRAPDGVPLGKPSSGRMPTIADGRGFVFVSHTGDVFPSGFLPLRVGNVREGSLIQTYRTHPVMQRLRDSTTFDGKCGECEYRFMCGGSRARAYAASGNPFASDPACSYVPGSWVPA